LADHVVIGQNTVIHTQNHDYDTGNKIPFGSGWSLKPVCIDEGVWIASSVIILPGTHIGEGAIIQAGSVVHGEIPPFAIAGGNPCRPFSQRNKERYLQLKDKGLWQTW
jgi:acetyltransferase-like isoleucine patch superfamily enzyme